MPVNWTARLAVILTALLATVNHATASTDGWYQIEVIVFANNTVTDTDEVWPLRERHYPDPMVRIGPQTPAELQPTTIGQLQDLQAYLALWDNNNEVSTPNESQDFLFESRRNPVYTPDTSQTSESSSAAADPADLNGTDSEATDAAPDVLDFETLFTTEAPVAYQDLPNSARLLGSVARSLRRSSLYRVLAHQSWLQPVMSEEAALPILIQGGKRFDDNYELDGSLTISRSRFLHLDLDLWFTQFSPLYQESNPASRFGSSPLDGSLAISAEVREQYPEVADWLSNRGQFTPVHAHQLTQSRRMRSSTMHFIDHPHFGVLIRTERYEPDSDA